jgi:hypothetical protein
MVGVLSPDPRLGAVAVISGGGDFKRVSYVLERHGYLAFTEDGQMCVNTFRYIIPEHVESCLSKMTVSGKYIPRALNSIWLKKDIAITRAIVERARRMLDLDYTYEFSKFYRSFLRVLLGMPIELNFNEDEVDFLIHMMLQVGHPQLTADLVRDRKWLGTLESPTIIYDPVSFFQAFYGIFSIFPKKDDYATELLFAHGREIELYEIPLFRELYIEK